jgi:hypothetical protein
MGVGGPHMCGAAAHKSAREWAQEISELWWTASFNGATNPLAQASKPFATTPCAVMERVLQRRLEFETSVEVHA